MPDLQRGIVRAQHGDLCAARAVTATQAATERAAIVANSSRMLLDPDTQLTIVQVPGGSPFALPQHVFDAIRKAARR